VKLKVHYQAHKSPLLDPIQTKMNEIHFREAFLFKINVAILVIFTDTLCLSRVLFFHMFQLNCRPNVHFASPCAHSALRSSHYPGAAHPNICRQRVKILMDQRDMQSRKRANFENSFIPSEIYCLARVLYIFLQRILKIVLMGKNIYKCNYKGTQ
jgi:hypothetical protein